MRLLEYEIDPVTCTEAVDWARNHLRFPYQRGYIATVNASTLMAMRSNRQLRQFIGNAALTVADCQPTVWLSKLFPKSLPEPVAAVDLVPGLCQAATDVGVSVYLMGSKLEVVEDVVLSMRRQVPGLRVAGVSVGHFERHESRARVDAISRSGASVLILGVPEQERFLEENWDALGVRLALPVGDALEIISKGEPQTNAWTQKSGLGWLSRLYVESQHPAKRLLAIGARSTAVSMAWLARLTWRFASLFLSKGAH